jgi:hypothetical protein
MYVEDVAALVAAGTQVLGGVLRKPAVVGGEKRILTPFVLDATDREGVRAVLVKSRALGACALITSV